MFFMEKWFLPFYLVSMGLGWLVLGAMILSFSSAFSRTLVWGIFTMILVSSFLSWSVLVFYMLFEFSLLPILFMIIYWGSQPERLSAGLYLLIYTSMMSMPLMVIIISYTKTFFFLFTKSTSFLVALIILIPFLVKMPVFGLHFWLPKAHVEASTSGSMILAGVLLKLGSYGAIRLSSLFFLKGLSLTMGLWLVLSVASSFVTFMQSDVKKLVAYSSVTHMTFMMIGIAILNKNVFLVVLFLSLAHGWASMGMFSQAGLMSMSTSSRLGFTLKSESKFHWISILLGLILAANASLPPFPSFFPELMLVSSLSAFSPLVTLFIFLSLTVCYYNALFFFWVANNKSMEVKQGFSKPLDCIKLVKFNLISAVSLLWFMVL